MPLNVRNWQETYGERSLNVTRLHDIPNEGARRQIENPGVPALDLETFRQPEVVKPGTYGAPEVNAGGAGVGVVDGVLHVGTASLHAAVTPAFLDECMATGNR